MSDEDAALELHHLVIAGFIVFAELGAMVQQLTDHPDVHAKLTAEVQAHAPAGALTLEQITAMPYLLQVVNEVKRLCPIMPVVFGKTKAPLRIRWRVGAAPAGW